MDKKIKNILIAAIRAPSGDNIQPWRFAVEESAVNVHLSLDGAESIYDYQRHASAFSAGAVLENIVVEARYEKLHANITLFPDEDDDLYIARVEFTPLDIPMETDGQYRRLHESIFNRVVNRKKYKSHSVSKEFQAHVLTIPQQLGISAQLHIVDDPQRITLLAKQFSYGDGLVFKVRSFHDSLYSYLLWTKKEMVEKKAGLYVKTLELPWFNVVGMWLSRLWFLVKLGDIFGASRMVAKMQERVYVNTGAYCAITMPSNTLLDFVNAGRVFQRTWLEATGSDLYLHPHYSFALIEQLLDGGVASVVADAETDNFKTKLAALREIYGIRKDRKLVMCFRLGHGKPPSTTSDRKPVTWLLKDSVGS